MIDKITLKNALFFFSKNPTFVAIPLQQMKWSSIFFALNKTKLEEKLSSIGILPNMIIVPVLFSKE